MALELLTKDLSPEQEKDKRYQTRRHKPSGDIVVTGQQRSWIDLMLRKNLGYAKVFFLIFKHGISDLFDPPLIKQQPTKVQLKNILEGGMHWHASMLQSILEMKTIQTWIARDSWVP